MLPGVNPHAHGSDVFDGCFDLSWTDADGRQHNTFTDVFRQMNPLAVLELYYSLDTWVAQPDGRGCPYFVPSAVLARYIAEGKRIRAQYPPAPIAYPDMTPETIARTGYYRDGIPLIGVWRCFEKADEHMLRQMIYDSRPDLHQIWDSSTKQWVTGLLRPQEFPVVPCTPTLGEQIGSYIFSAVTFLTPAGWVSTIISIAMNAAKLGVTIQQANSAFENQAAVAKAVAGANAIVTATVAGELPAGNAGGWPTTDSQPSKLPMIAGAILIAALVLWPKRK